jgi:hypothetical protein
MRVLVLKAIAPIWLFISITITILILYHLSESEKLVVVFITVNCLIGIGYILCQLKSLIQNEQRRFLTEYLERYIHG